MVKISRPGNQGTNSSKRGEEIKDTIGVREIRRSGGQASMKSGDLKMMPSLRSSSRLQCNGLVQSGNWGLNNRDSTGEPSSLHYTVYSV